MLAGERELYQRFAAYDDEELLRLLTVERAQYRTEALSAAEVVLRQRGIPQPAPFIPQQAPPAPGRAWPGNPYRLIDLFVDAILFGTLYWVTSEMDGGSVLPESWLADGAVRLLVITLLTLLVTYLRQGWRTKTW
jgi:hypothetical protein